MRRSMYRGLGRYILVLIPRAYLLSGTSSAPAAAAASQNASFGVKVTLQSSWPEVPQQAAELEWLKRLSPTLATGALKKTLGSTWPHESLVTEHGAIGSVLVANRYFSPAVEAQRATCRALRRNGQTHVGAQDASNFLPCAGAAFAAIKSDRQSFSVNLACTPLELEEQIDYLNTSRGTRDDLSELSIDHLLCDDSYGSSKTTTVVICGCILDVQLRAFLNWAFNQKCGNSSSLKIVYRQADCIHDHNHAPPSSADVGDTLTGYGVELRIKSTEYKATDDAVSPLGLTHHNNSISPQAGDTSNDDDKEDDEDAKIQGFDINMEESMDDGLDVELKRSELQELSLQVLQRCIRSTSPLKTLGAIADNFPALMARLARNTSVRPRFRRAVRELRDVSGVGESEQA